MSGDSGEVTLERRDALGIITLRRPAKKNALDQQMWQDLERILAELRADPPRVVLVVGEGDAFCAGHDIHPESALTAAMAKGMVEKDPEPVRRILKQLKGTLAALAALPMPTIAAINGKAYSGGLELCLCCDLRVMDADAVLCLQETKLGMMPDISGTVRMIKLVGRALALELIYTSRGVGSAEALAMGLVNRVAPPGESLDAALALAGEIAANGPTALAGVKQVALAMDQLEPALDVETEMAVATILSGEPMEGVTAWLSRRPPRF